MSITIPRKAGRLAIGLFAIATFSAVALLSAMTTWIVQANTVVAVDANRLAPRPPTNTADLVAVDTNFGTAWADVEFRHRLRIINPSSQPVVVERITADCNCTSVSPGTFTLAPGAEQELAVAIDLTQKSGSSAVRTRSAFSTSLTLVSTERSQQIELRGTVAFPFAAPGAIQIESPLSPDQSAPAQRFTVWKDPLIDTVNVEADPAEAEVVEVTTAIGSASVTYELRPRSNRPLGRFQFDLQLTATADDGQTFGPMRIPVSGRVEGDIAWSPEDVLLVDVGGSPPREDVVFWSRTGRPFEVIDLTAPADLVAAEMLAADSSADVGTPVLTLSASQEITRRKSGAVVVTARTSDGSVYKIPIPITIQPLSASDSAGEDENQ